MVCHILATFQQHYTSYLFLSNILNNDDNKWWCCIELLNFVSNLINLKFDVCKFHICMMEFEQGHMSVHLHIFHNHRCRIVHRLLLPSLAFHLHWKENIIIIETIKIVVLYKAKWKIQFSNIEDRIILIPFFSAHFPYGIDPSPWHWPEQQSLFCRQGILTGLQDKPSATN